MRHPALSTVIRGEVSVLLAVIITVVCNAPARAQGLGLSIAWQRGDAWRYETIAMLNPPAWKDWTFDHVGEPGYLPEVYTMAGSQWSQAAMAKAKDDNSIWLLGSEPEVQVTYVAPEVAAEFSRQWAAQVGGQWAAPGVATWDAGYAWLDAYLAAGGLVGDYWHIHVYQVYERGDWTAKWAEWKAWMVAHDVVRPTIVSETCGWWYVVNMVVHTPDQTQVMDEIVSIQAQDPLLDTVLWYSDADYWRLWVWADLRTNKRLTRLGQHFIDVQPPVGGQQLPQVTDVYFPFLVTP